MFMSGDIRISYLSDKYSQASDSWTGGDLYGQAGAISVTQHINGDTVLQRKLYWLMMTHV